MPRYAMTDWQNGRCRNVPTGDEQGQRLAPACKVACIEWLAQLAGGLIS